ncbi:hypothetical protein CAEBREN_03711 [Caenorhabditis brenneri]|uniref:Uncharacterized protein n=1 Tax=Caenorhabditis brenneri TaxID=135651 RepID=G0NM28_CAEBE|nr:hypothetical protein CAEBREN_03711 [Caenorhabditis brenneri]
MSLAHIDIKSGTTTRRLSENALVVKCDSGSSAITISTESDPDIEMCSLSLKNIHEVCTFGDRCLQWNRRASNQVVTLTFLQASGSEAMANAILANCVWIRLMDGIASNTDLIGEVVSTRDRIAPVIYKYGLTLEQIESLLKALAWKCSKELEDGLERRFTVGVHLNPDKTLRGISPWPEKIPNQSEIVEDSMAVEAPRGPSRMSMIHSGTTDRSRSRISRRSSPSPLSSPTPPRRAALQMRTRRKPTPFDPSHQYKALKYIYRAYKDYGHSGVSLGSDTFWQRFLDYEGITTKTARDWRIHFHQSLRHKISHFRIAPYRRRDLLCFIGIARCCTSGRHGLH